jgi:ABC-type antimicrobial peptide transport system permease subunit
MVLREVAVIVAAGIVVGLPAAWALSRLVHAQLFGLSPTDPLTLLLAATTLGAVGLFAGYVPARRATRVEPLLAIREL